MTVDATGATWSASHTRLHAVIRAHLNEHDGTWDRTNAKADAIANALLAAGFGDVAAAKAEALEDAADVWADQVASPVAWLLAEAAEYRP